MLDFITFTAGEKLYRCRLSIVLSGELHPKVWKYTLDKPKIMGINF